MPAKQRNSIEKKIWTAKAWSSRILLEKKTIGLEKELKNTQKKLNDLITSVARKAETMFKDKWPIIPKDSIQSCPVCGGDMELCDAEKQYVCCAIGTIGGADACGCGRMRLPADEYEKRYGEDNNNEEDDY